MEHHVPINTSTLVIKVSTWLFRHFLKNKFY